jgi:hypothetical protein
MYVDRKRAENKRLKRVQLIGKAVIAKVRAIQSARRRFKVAGVKGSILQNSVSAENLSVEILQPQILDEFLTKKQQT